jgi:hypothetical protein
MPPRFTSWRDSCSWTRPLRVIFGIKVHVTFMNRSHSKHSSRHGSTNQNPRNIFRSGVGSNDASWPLKARPPVLNLGPFPLMGGLFGLLRPRGVRVSVPRHSVRTPRRLDASLPARQDMYTTREQQSSQLNKTEYLFPPLVSRRVPHQAGLQRDHNPSFAALALYKKTQRHRAKRLSLHE